MKNGAEKFNDKGNTSAEFVSKVLEQQWFQLLVISLLTILAYSNSFQAEFAFDDNASIINNKVIRHLGNFFFNSSGYVYNPRRFIGYMSIAMNYHFGGLNVFGYHLVNLAIHVVNVVLVYELVRITLRTPFFAGLAGIGEEGIGSKERETRLNLQELVPFFTALLFAVHPIQTEAVTYIIQRLTSLMSLFYLLSIYLYVRMRLLGESGGTEWKVAGLVLLSLISAILAMKTKENAFTLPFVAVLYEFCFFRGAWLKRVWLLLPLLATALIIPLSMLNIQKPVGEVISDVSRETMVQTTLPRWDYLCTQFRVIVTYLRLLILPVRQNVDYDYPVYNHLFTPPVLLSFIFLLILFCLAVYLYFHSRFKDRTTNFEEHISPITFQYSRLIAFGIFWFFITISVESSIIPIVDVIFEHRLYLPSVGAFLAFIGIIFYAAERLKDRIPLFGRALVPMLALVTVAFAATAYCRNNTWRNDKSLWMDTLRKSPLKARPWNNLAFYYLNQTDPTDAFPALQRSLSLDPYSYEAWDNMGRALFMMGRTAEAEKCYKRALTIKPDYQNSWVNLALAQEIQGKLGEAVQSFRRAIELMPDDDKARLYLKRTLKEIRQ